MEPDVSQELLELGILCLDALELTTQLAVLHHESVFLERGNRIETQQELLMLNHQNGCHVISILRNAVLAERLTWLIQSSTMNVLVSRVHVRLAAVRFN